MAPKKARKQREKQEFTEEDAKALLRSKGHFIVSSKDRFHFELANNLENAWTTRGSERFLYTVFSHIISHLCDTIIPPQFPTSTISHTPQLCFRFHEPPPGEPAEKISKKDLHPEQIPDFARMIFTFTDSPTGRGILRRLIDFWEIKGLNIAERWDTQLARSKAFEAIEHHIEQLWKQARAAFAHNPTWTVVYALLIIGPYFSQVVWQRPPGIVEPPTPDLSKSSATSTPELLQNYNARIEEAKARDVPRVEFYNAPVFVFDAIEDGQAQVVHLSTHFLYALSLPIKEQFNDCATEQSWFDPPPQKPGQVVQDGDPELDLDALLREALIDKCVATLEGKRDAEFASASSVGDSPDDATLDFELTPSTKRILRALDRHPVSSPIANNRGKRMGRMGVGAANQRQPPPVPLSPRRAARGQPIDPSLIDDEEDQEDQEDQDDEASQDEEELIGVLRGLGLHDAEEDDGDFADDEETAEEDEETVEEDEETWEDDDS